MKAKVEPNINPLVYLPGEAAKMMRYSPETLLALMRTHRYEFVPLVPGGKPGDKGRRWGLTREQIEAIIRDQTRQLPGPGAKEEQSEFSPMSPDGKRRMKKGRKTRLQF